MLDTWFSSALWPFSTLGWPEQTADLAKFYPTSVLVTGYDILFFWVARMMMFGLYAMDGVPPFDVVALHGMVRDQFGKKMSKSFGNVVDPLDWIDATAPTRSGSPWPAAPTRAPTCRSARSGCQGSRNFCNKLWNATRFALLNGATVDGDAARRGELVDRRPLDPVPAAARRSPRWTRTSRRTSSPRSCDALYHFAWDEVCDWYLELTKPVLAGGGAAGRRRPGGCSATCSTSCCGCCTR